MEWLLFTELLRGVLNKLLKFLLNMDPMLIFKPQFWFSFFICCVSCWLWMVVGLCDITSFLFFFLTTFFLLKNGWTALHYAADRGFEQIVKILVEHRSNINIQTKVFIFFFFLKIFFCCNSWDLLNCDGWVEWFGVVFFFETFFFLIFFYCVRMGKQCLMLQKIRTLLNWSSNWRFYFFYFSLFFFFFWFYFWVEVE